MSKDKQKTVLVYRRTHTGDPSSHGVFGCHDCMGSTRTWNYNAAIGIGGMRPWGGDEGIARKITWIGTGPFLGPTLGRAPQVGFENFRLWDEDGPLLVEVAPKLYEYMFEQGKILRAALVSLNRNYPPAIYEEVVGLLELAQDAPRSKPDWNSSIPQHFSEPKPDSDKHGRGCR